MKVKELLSTKEAWTTKAYARDPLGYAVESIHPAAVAWCLQGAFNKCYPIFSSEEEARAFQSLTATLRQWFLLEKSPTESILSFNDTATYEQVLELVTEADV